MTLADSIVLARTLPDRLPRVGFKAVIDDSWCSRMLVAKAQLEQSSISSGLGLFGVGGYVMSVVFSSRG